MRLLVALVVAGMLVAAASPAGAAVPQTGAQVAAALKQNPVYADPRARPTLTAAQAERVRLRIAQRAPGRLAIAVVSSAVTRSAGGIRELARAIDRDFDVNGALLVIDSDTDNAWVVVSYDDPSLATRAVQAAYAGKGSFYNHTLEAVDRLGAADPGPGGPPGNGGPTTTIPDVVTDVQNTVKTVFIVVGVLIALPFVIVFLMLLTRGRRRRRRATQPCGLASPSPTTAQVTAPTAPQDFDEQRQAAEKAFGGDA